MFGLLILLPVTYVYKIRAMRAAISVMLKNRWIGHHLEGDTAEHCLAKLIQKHPRQLYILLNVHLGKILVNNQLDPQFFFVYTGCPRRNVPDFGRVFLMLKYTDITQNTYVQS